MFCGAAGSYPLVHLGFLEAPEAAHAMRDHLMLSIHLYRESLLILKCLQISFIDNRRSPIRAISKSPCGQLARY